MTCSIYRRSRPANLYSNCPITRLRTLPRPAGYAPQIEALRLGLRDQGYIEGQNIAVEYRWAEGRYDRLPGLAADLVRRKVAVIVTQGTPAAFAAKQATTTIPIVMAVVGNPVDTGLVSSLAQP